MATLVGKYKLKRSNVPGEVPSSLDLDVAELAVNTADGRLFIKKDDNTIFEFAGLGATALGDLVDVDLAAGVTDGQVLVYDSAEGEWQPVALDLSKGLEGAIVAPVPPTTRDDGSSLQEGDLWFNSTLSTINVYYQADWVDITGSNSSFNLIDDSTPQLGGALDTNGFAITSPTDEDVVIYPSPGKALRVRSDLQPGTIKFSGSNTDYYAAIKGPADSAQAQYTLTLPNSAGDAGQVLISDGTGVLSWANNGEGLGLGLNDLIDVSYSSGAFAPDGLQRIEFPAGASELNQVYSVSNASRSYLGMYQQASNADWAQVEVDGDYGIQFLTYRSTVSLFDASGANSALRWAINDPALGNQAQYVELKCNPSSAARGNWTNQTYLLPEVMGSANDVLKLGENNQLEWVPFSAGSFLALNDITDVSYVDGNFAPDLMRRIEFDTTLNTRDFYLQIGNGSTDFELATETSSGEIASVTLSAGEGVKLATDSGFVWIAGDADSVTNSPELRFSTGDPFAADGQGAHLGFKLPENFYLSKTYTLPLADGAPGQVLTTNGSGVMSWAAPVDGGIEGIGDLDDVDTTGAKLSHVLQYDGQGYVSRDMNQALAQPLPYEAEGSDGSELLGSAGFYADQAAMEADGFTAVAGSAGADLSALTFPVPVDYQNIDYVGLNTSGLTHWYLNTSGAVYAHTQEAILVGNNLLAQQNAAEVEIYVQAWGQHSRCRVAGYQEHTDANGDEWFVLRGDFAIPSTDTTKGFPVEWWFGKNKSIRVLYGNREDGATFIAAAGASALISRGSQLTEWGSSVSGLGEYTVEILSQGGTNLSAIGNVSDVAPLDGQALVWSDANQLWEPGAGGGGDVTDGRPVVSWSVTADGNSSYIFEGDGFAGTETDPVLYVVRGQTYKITNLMGMHPLRIQSTPGTSGAAYNDGITNNSVQSGTLTWEVRLDAPSELYYQCTSHSSMAGTIQVLENSAGAAGITVQERAGSTGAPQNPASEITTLSFNTNNGFSVTDLGNGEALVNLGSAFAPWYVAGQDTLDPEGEEPITFVAGSGIEITTVSTSDPKQIIFSSTGGGSGGGGGGGSNSLFLSESLVISGTGSFTGLGHAGTFRRVSSSAEAWITFYGSGAELAADAGRSFGTDPEIGSGVQLEVYLTAGQEVTLSPGMSYFNNDDTAAEVLYVAVRTNAGAATTSVVDVEVFGEVTLNGVNGGTFGSG